MVGQHYVALLQDHPIFDLVHLSASDNSNGKTYGEACLKWYGPHPLQPRIANMRLGGDWHTCDLLFVCAGDETPYLEAGLTVITSQSSMRHHPQVPLLIPEINAHHLDILPHQPWKGSLIAKPNCSLQSYLLPLYPLLEFGIEKIIVTTLQALSGGGIGLMDSKEMSSYIPHEEEKSETEPQKILGHIENNTIVPTNLTISAHCNRIPVPHGHTACVSVAFKRRPTEKQMLEAWQAFSPVVYEAPSTPMQVSLSRLRPCPVLDYRFVGHSHNVIRGAAGGGILNAQTYVDRCLTHA